MRTNHATPLQPSPPGAPTARARPPSLALPFAVVGLAAGWISDGLLANPVVGFVPRKSQATAAVMAGLVAGALGTVLSRWIRTRGALGEQPLTWRSLAALVTLGGAVTGAMVGAMEAGTGWSALSGAANGGLSAVAFVPVCALVVAATRRADRARQGSIVAAADRRAVWSILAMALALTTLAAALDVPPSHYEQTAALPRAGVVMAVAAGAVILAALVADAFALARVIRLRRSDLEEHDPAEGRHVGVVPSVDLGLGDDVRARPGRAATAYRSRALPVALLVGSPDNALAALGRALLRGALGLALSGAALAGHAWAETPAALAEYQALRCPDSTNACHDAGVLLLPDRPAARDCPSPPFAGTGAPTPDVPRAEALLKRGCEGGNRCACHALQHSARRRGAEVALPSWYIPH